MKGKPKTKRYYQNLYRLDQDVNAYLVEVSLDDYDDVYDDWDPSPFKKRDIEDEFNDFIVDSSGDIPLSSAISIVLHLPEEKRSEEKEIILVSAYRYFYSYIVQRLKKELNNQRMKALSYLGLAIIFMSIGYFFTVEGQSMVFTVLHEGILIGGWVFLWEFIHTLFITGRDKVRDFGIYQRLLNAEVRFEYYETPE